MRFLAEQVLSVGVSLLWLAGSAEAQEVKPTEYQVKAAFLFNFAKFVDWPTNAFAREDSAFVIGVLGTSPFGQDLEQTVRNKSVGGHRLNVLTASSIEEARKCHILFISASEVRRLREVFDGLRGASVLTVGETARFIDNGGMIGFLMEGQKVRFEINAEAARSAGLKISSKLLSLAEHPAH
jgi:hypothetical protein